MLHFAAKKSIAKKTAANGLHKNWSFIEQDYNHISVLNQKQGQTVNKSVEIVT